MRFYIGTYTSQKARPGFTSANSMRRPVRWVSPTLAAKRVSILRFLRCIPPKRTLLYAVNESDAGQISAFAIDDASSQLRLLNQQSTSGAAPCDVSLDASGRCAMVANYVTGNVAVFPIEDDGRLLPAAYIDQHHGHGPDASRQEGPHAHCILPDPAGRFVFSCDLGIDQILIYELDAGSAKLRAHSPPFATTGDACRSGCQTRHITFHRTAPFAYVITEMANTLCVYSATTHRPVRSRRRRLFQHCRRISRAPAMLRRCVFTRRARFSTPPTAATIPSRFLRLIYRTAN